MIDPDPVAQALNNHDEIAALQLRVHYLENRVLADRIATWIVIVIALVCIVGALLW